MNHRSSILFTLAKACFIGATFLIISSAARVTAASTTPVYPQFRLAPARPTTQDSVSFWFVKGTSNLTCYPRYSTSFSSGTSGGYVRILIRYQELILGIACMVMTDTVEYGPKFNFGKLHAGNYIIVDSLTNLGLDTFSVITPGPKDSVLVTPASPTTRDSLDFSLFGANLTCGGTVHDDTVLIVNDTCIYLSFSYQECNACACPSMGRWIPFHSKPLDAGTYGIYKAQSAYCPPGAVCILAPIIPERVGQVTVRPATADAGSMMNAGSKRPFASLERSSNVLRLSLSEAQSVTLEMYSPSGRKIATLLNREQCGPGTYRLPLNKFSALSGCMIAKLTTATTVSLAAITLLR